MPDKTAGTATDAKAALKAAAAAKKEAAQRKKEEAKAAKAKAKADKAAAKKAKKDADAAARARAGLPPKKGFSCCGCCCGSKVADGDMDGDGIPDHLDQDMDGDGIPDHLQDADGDGIPDHIQEEYYEKHPELEAPPPPPQSFAGLPLPKFAGEIVQSPADYLFYVAVWTDETCRLLKWTPCAILAPPKRAPRKYAS